MENLIHDQNETGLATKVLELPLQPVEVDPSLLPEGAWVEGGHIMMPSSVRVIPRSRKLAYTPVSAYSSNSVDNYPWHLASTAKRADPFSGVSQDVNGSTGFIENTYFDQAIGGDGVDYIDLEGSGIQAIGNHPEWVDSRTGLTRFVQFNWASLRQIEIGQAVSGSANGITLASSASPYPGFYIGDNITITAGLGAGQTREISFYNLNNNIYANNKFAFVSVNWVTAPDSTSVYQITPSAQSPTYYSTDITGNHGTSALSIAGGRLYGFAKYATLYSLGVAFGTRADTAKAICIATEFHKKKIDKTRPTVLQVNITVGVYLTNVANATTAVILGNTVGINLSTPEGRTAAQDNFNIPIFTGNETFGANQSLSFTTALQLAVDAGVIVVWSSGNQSARLVSSQHSSYNDYINLPDGSRFYFNRGMSSETPNVISVGAYQTNYVDGKEPVAIFSNKGPLIDVWAPGTAITAATTNSSGTGTVAYPGGQGFYTTMFGGTSAAGPITGGVVACLAQTRKWMNSADAKAGIRDAAILGRMHVPVLDKLSNKNSLCGADDRLLHFPWQHKSQAAFV